MTAATYSRSRHVLASKYWDLLVDGMAASWHTSRSEAVRAFILHAIHRGWDWPEFWHYMSQPERYKLAEVYHRRGGRHSHRRRPDPARAARADWDRAVAAAAASPAIDGKTAARAELADIRDHAAHTRFRCQTDRYILTWLHNEAQRRGRIVLAAAVRSIHLGTGISITTVIVSLRRLTAAGWIAKAGEREHVREAQTYRLRTPAGESHFQNTGCTPGGPPRTASGDRVTEVGLVPLDLETATTDAFLHLGRHRATVYTVLAGGPSTAAQVVKASGMSRSAVYRHLKYLADAGLAVSEGGVWRRVERDLGELAAEMGATGLGAARRARVARDRAGWDLVADRAQFVRDRARYGLRDAVVRAVAFERERGLRRARAAGGLAMAA